MTFVPKTFSAKVDSEVDDVTKGRLRALGVLDEFDYVTGYILNGIIVGDIKETCDEYTAFEWSAKVDMDTVEITSKYERTRSRWRRNIGENIPDINVALNNFANAVNGINFDGIREAMGVSANSLYGLYNAQDVASSYPSVPSDYDTGRNIEIHSILDEI